MPQSSGCLALGHLAAGGEEAARRRVQLEVGGMLGEAPRELPSASPACTAVSAGWRQSIFMYGAQSICERGLEPVEDLRVRRLARVQRRCARS
jgi:hypothetical protein